MPASGARRPQAVRPAPTPKRTYVTNDLLEESRLARFVWPKAGADSQTGNRVQWNFHDCLPQQAKLLPNRQRSECPLSVCALLVFVCACELFIERFVPFRCRFPLVPADFYLPRLGAFYGSVRLPSAVRGGARKPKF